jgi:DNA-binding protein HU-beta
VPAKFVISKARGGKFRFELVASNGKVLAQSMTHDTKRAAVAALKSVQKNASTDVVDDQSEPERKAAGKAAAAKTAAGRATARKTAAKSTTGAPARKTAARKTTGAATKATAKKASTRSSTRSTARKRVPATATAPQA